MPILVLKETGRMDVSKRAAPKGNNGIHGVEVIAGDQDTGAQKIRTEE